VAACGSGGGGMAAWQSAAAAWRNVGVT